MGALLLFHKGVPVYPLLWQMLLPHIEFLLLGWTLQLGHGRCLLDFATLFTRARKR
jgi:hypothetical protein